MILNNAPQDQAVLSNVGQIGEFRIRNSAKAFNILSSGLYANKIRAIIRELSCNAVDSHVAAGKGNTPFDIHLPNSLEPWFSIRDYGTGLSHTQVQNIYTTYFESTKTGSNEFIGALGLGSKSPFSYTDNFTVTAVQNNKKGVYTAFINEQGIPSIALMMEEESSDPNGVEVKFSVNDRYDFDRFHQEARAVYKYFKQRPVVSGASNFEFTEPVYKDKDIIPGVHHTENSTSYALMGNIAYPIEVPKSEITDDNKIYSLLKHGLVLEFDIGELDFQASREGLSYIPLTLNSIKTKLEALNKQLALYIAKEADNITNNWEKALFLERKSNNNLWQQAVNKYVTDTKFSYLTYNQGWSRIHTFKLDENVLKEKHNIVLRGFNKARSSTVCSNIKARSASTIVNDKPVYSYYFEVAINSHTRFSINDTKTGSLERAKYHVKESDMMQGKDGLVHLNMFVVEAHDKTKPIDVVGFKTLLANPPESYFLKVSELLEKDRAGGMGKNVTIMELTERGSGGYYRRDEMVWRDAGNVSKFTNTETYYYLPLSGFQSLGKHSDVKVLYNQVTKSGLFRGTIYGVRKGDIEFIKTQKNWINIDTHISDILNKMDNKNIMGMVKQSIDIDNFIKYNITDKVNVNSPFKKLVDTFKDVVAVDVHKQNYLRELCKVYDVKTGISPQAVLDKYTTEANIVRERYPLLQSIGYSVSSNAVAEYINLIDQSKGV